MNAQRIRVVVVDDDLLVLKIVAASLGNCPDLEVVGTATDASVARDMILELAPDVVTLDLAMPKIGRRLEQLVGQAGTAS
jgi:two-component system chemotaxis response regulator CheB